jgi:hypothetical protein
VVLWDGLLKVQKMRTRTEVSPAVSPKEIAAAEEAKEGRMPGI